MPSDGSRLAWLRSQALGVVLGQAAALLLAVGSVVLVQTREGASRGVHGDDLHAFFDPVSPWHLWLYLLIAVLALYALNTAVCLWDAVRARLSRRVRGWATWGPVLVHASFLVALVAHLVGGLYGEDRPPVEVGAGWGAFAQGLEARATALEDETWPDGSRKAQAVTLELRRPGESETWTHRVTYNRPWTAGLGSELLLLQRVGEGPGRVLFASGDVACALLEGESCTMGAHRVTLEGVEFVAAGGAATGTPLATVRVDGKSRRMTPRHDLRLGDTTLVLRGVERGPRALLRHRYAPGNPLGLLAAAVMTAGLLLMARRLA